MHAAGNLLHAELTTVVVPKASEPSYHLFLFYMRLFNCCHWQK